MSGHSKWSTIRHKKGAADAKRAAVFTKLAKAITVAAREGGGDPEFNFKLRSAVDAAFAGNMPKDNIEKAIKRGTGEIEGGVIDEVVYEGYGPGGVAVLLEALTDNRNRTSANLKHIFGKYGGNLAGAGAVQWMFERKGVVRTESGDLSEEAELALIDAGAEDISVEGEERVINTAADALAKVRDAADKAGLKVVSAELEWVNKEEPTAIDSSAKESLEKLLGALDEDEDVSNLYTSADLS